MLLRTLLTLLIVDASWNPPLAWKKLIRCKATYLSTSKNQSTFKQILTIRVGQNSSSNKQTATKNSRYSIILVDIISHVTYRNANKYLNVHQELKLVEANKVGPLYIFSVLRIVSVCEKKLIQIGNLQILRTHCWLDSFCFHLSHEKTIGDRLPRCFASSTGSFDATFFSFIAIVVEVLHTVGKIYEFN